MEGSSQQPAIGIDLGTTYSCVAVWRNNQIEIMANDQGNRTTPSWVAFTETQRYIGEGAQKQAFKNYKNTVFDVKRLIGRRFRDDPVQRMLNNWPFEVISGEGDKPMIVVQFKGERKEFCPEQISSFVLRKMVDTAEALLGHTIKDVVVTIPAYFNDQQRQATIDAGRLARLTVLAIINEPTAAAMAYNFHKKSNRQSVVLIFDLGGGTFDVTIAKVIKGDIKVVATHGDTNLGGMDFDNNMMDYVIEEFKRKHDNEMQMDIRKNPRALGKLRAECEKAKRALSVNLQTDIDIDSLHEGIDFSITITRAKFEYLNKDLFKKCIHTVDECLKEKHMDKSEVDDIVLVGGSTKIPMIQSMLQYFFNGKVLSKVINPDEAVAYGAALKAAYLSNNKVQDMVLQDVTPLSYGTDLIGRRVDVLIPRCTSIPTKKEKVYYTTQDNQTCMSLDVYMGESRYIQDCRLLDRFTFSGIPPAPRGLSTITVSFEIDTDGILKVSAVDNTNGKRMEATIPNNQGRLKNADISKMVLEAEGYNAGDVNHKKNLELKDGLERAIIYFKNSVIADDNIISKDRKKILSLIELTEEWLKKDKLADGDKFRDEYKVHISLFNKALETARNSSKKSVWTLLAKALSAASTILPIVVPIINAISSTYFDSGEEEAEARAVSNELRPLRKKEKKIAASEHEMKEPGTLSVDFINYVEAEVLRLEELKASKMKELVLKKRSELDEKCRQTHLVAEADSSMEYAIEAIESGTIDPSCVLEQVEVQIAKVKEEAFSRKEILEKVEKWLAACEEESWLEEYNRDENRYNAGRGAHLTLKRVEKACALVAKFPAIMEALACKTTTWERERGVDFTYDGVRLLSMLEEQEKEKEQLRQQDQKRLQGQLITEQVATTVGQNGCGRGWVRLR
ncbi:hypothetical protein AAC387_Pa09g1896 [Persea americana]